MEIAGVSEIPHTNRPHKNVDVIEKFLKSGNSKARITDGDRPADKIYASLRCTIRKNPFYKKNVYSCTRNGYLYICRIGESK